MTDMLERPVVFVQLDLFSFLDPDSPQEEVSPASSLVEPDAEVNPISDDEPASAPELSVFEQLLERQRQAPRRLRCRSILQDAFAAWRSGAITRGEFVRLFPLVPDEDIEGNVGHGNDAEVLDAPTPRPVPRVEHGKFDFAQRAAGEAVRRPWND